MTSNPRTTECYVYIMLPGMTEFITAGKLVVKTDPTGQPLGRFVYGRRYLERQDAVAIDPIELKLSNKTFQTTALKGLFGALRDAGPDYWGRRVIEKQAGLIQLNEMDYLLHSPDDRAGALGFGLNPTPPAPLRQFNRTIDLEKLQKLADSLIDDEDLPLQPETGQVENLLLLGTSMGGARPKAVVEDNNSLWVAKFNRSDDPWNYARVEHAMLLLARQCGIETAESRVVSVGNRDVLLVKRFDREQTGLGYTRARMISSLTLLQAEDTHQDRGKWSYVLMSEALRRVSINAKQDAQELFRRMCFNGLISNTDDHPRNHALIAKDQNWRLSPAYDLTPTTPVSLERRDLALECGDFGRYAHADNFLSQCRRFLLTPEEAKTLIHTMEQQVKNGWYAVARKAGVTEKECEKIKSAFAYEGFWLRSRF